MRRRLIILGTGGGALDALDIVDAINGVASQWEVVGFLDDNRPEGSESFGLPVLGRLQDAPRYSDHAFVNVIGSDRSHRARPEVIAATGLGPEAFATLVHPLASTSPRARLGRGVCVNFGVSIGGNVSIGDHTTLCPGCIVGHDTVISDYAVLAPGSVVSGGVRLDRACYIGARAVIRQNLSVGARALVGMGAVVVSDVPEAAIVVGNPAHSLGR